MSRNQTEGYLIGFIGGTYVRSGKHGVRHKLAPVSIGDSRTRKWRKHWKMRTLKEMEPTVCKVCGQARKPQARFTKIVIDGETMPYTDYYRSCGQTHED